MTDRRPRKRFTMRRARSLVTIAVLAASLGLPGCATASKASPAASSSGSPSGSPSADCSPAHLTLIAPGTLTAATSKPAYPPYVENDDPASGKGYESAVV